MVTEDKGTMPSEVLSKESIFNLNPKPMPIVDRIIIQVDDSNEAGSEGGAET
jgi:hypothetical protein